MRPKPSPRSLAPRRRPQLLLALRRRPRLWWAVAGALGLAVAAAVGSAVSEAEAARAAWGHRTTVYVAAHDLPAGEELDASDLDRVERPAALVPRGAVAEAPSGRVLHSAVFQGEVLISARLAPDGLGPLAAVLPPGSRAVAVPVEATAAPPLQAGDRVDILVALPAEAAGAGPPGFAVAERALVVDVGDTAVTVAVDRDIAPKVAVALGQGAVTLALVSA